VDNPGERKTTMSDALNVLVLNGSPRINGNTSAACAEFAAEMEKEGVDVETVQLGNQDIRGCIACNYCATHGKCVFDDVVNELAPKLEAADGLVLASPVYYASANATLVAAVTRLYYSTGYIDKRMKVGAAIAVARRSGTTATFDELNKFFTIAGMPVASSFYWNNVHGRDKGEAAEDLEGLDSMRELARNMAFLMKSIRLGKEAYGMPEKLPHARTNFVR
jgi:multimeric flavodoxin WrbA